MATLRRHQHVIESQCRAARSINALQGSAKLSVGDCQRYGQYLLRTSRTVHKPTTGSNLRTVPVVVPELTGLLSTREHLITACARPSHVLLRLRIAVSSPSHSTRNSLTTTSLFRPYIKLDLRAANLYPHDTCTFCANEISALMNALRAMYGLRRVTLIVTSLLLSASTIHLLNLGQSEQAAAHLSQAVHDLSAISVNHRFAARAVDIIRSLSTKWNISLPESAAAIAVYRMDHGGRGDGRTATSSPPPSTFFAASITRELGPGAAQSHQNSPFLQQPPQQRAAPTSVPMFYSDPSTPFDEKSAQTAFWTPFPAQVMPIAQQEMGLGDFSALGGQHTNWNMFGSTGGGVGHLQQQGPMRHQSDPGHAGQDHSMSALQDWNWD